MTQKYISDDGDRVRIGTCPIFDNLSNSLARVIAKHALEDGHSSYCNGNKEDIYQKDKCCVEITDEPALYDGGCCRPYVYVQLVGYIRCVKGERICLKRTGAY